MPEDCCEGRQYTNLQSEIIIYMMTINAKKYFFPEMHPRFQEFPHQKMDNIYLLSLFPGRS